LHASPPRYVFEEPLFVTAEQLRGLPEKLKRTNVGVVIPGFTGSTALVSGSKVREICPIYAGGRVVSLAPPEYGEAPRSWGRQSAGVADVAWRDRLVREVSAGSVMTGFNRTPDRPLAACFVGSADAAVGWSTEARRQVVAFLSRLPAGAR
jgi:hypothetical protein